MRLGFIGLGAMGAPMAANLLTADFDVAVWSRSAARCEPLIAAGAERAASVAACAAGRDAVITMLADDAALHAIVDDHGLLEALPSGALHINMATVSIECARTLAERHARAGRGYVAAPVLGRPDIAKAAKLNIIAAGPDAAIERARPALNALGAQLWPAGPEAFRANAIKLAANLMLVTAVEAMSEALALATAHGVARDTFLDIVTRSVFAAPAYQGYAPAMRARDYALPDGFKLGLGAKDLDLALAAAEAGGLDLTLADAARTRLAAALAAGYGDHDLAALAETVGPAETRDGGASR